MSGVSKGTVDRVLHGRQGVARKTRTKVLDIIHQTGYMPNVYASLLSRKKTYTILAIIPYFQRGDYWELVHRGITTAGTRGNALNIDINIIYYNQFDLDSFRQACTHTLALNPHAVLLAPIYKDESARLAHQLSTRNIPLAYVDSKIENTHYLAYFGMPLFESGYLAAHLLLDDDDAQEIVNFNVDRGGAAPNDSMTKRWEGFRQYLADHHQGTCTIHNHSILPHDFMYNIKLFDAFFAQHPHVRHILALHSRAYLIAEWMEMRGIHHKKLLGFDMLRKNLQAVREGYITHLITERTAEDVCRAMQALVRFLVFKTKPERQDNFTSMDILNRYNVDFYPITPTADSSLTDHSPLAD
jgi:LacI family transcriptional regulator